jgi:hypothetical protein
MKAVIVMAVLVLASPRAWADHADRIRVPLSDPSRPAVVQVHLINGNITVKGGSTKEVLVDAEPAADAEDRDDEDDDDEKGHEGLRRLPFFSSGLTAEESNNEVTISADSMAHETSVTVTVPAHTSLVLRSVNGGEIAVSDVEGEIDAENVNGKVTLKNISGSAVAHAMNGALRASFKRVDPKKPMAFSSMNGTVDVTFPADIKANISLRADNGEVYSDFDVKSVATPPQPVVEDGRSKGGRFRVRVDRTVHAMINGGGQEIQFKCMNGNIYIRKGS